MHFERLTTGACRLPSLLGCIASIGVIGLLTGCDSKSFIDPTEMGRMKGPPLVVPILNTIDPGVEQGNDEFAYAVDPSPADLKEITGDYKISADDLINVSVSDLVQQGVETVRQLRVTEGGKILLPYIGPIQAAGLSETELTQAVTDAYRQAGMIQHADVSVQVVQAQGRAFSIQGAVANPGPYGIPESNFRMLDALAVARGTVSPLVEYAYIIRAADKSAAATNPASAPASTAPTTGPAPEDLAPHSDAGDLLSRPMHLADQPGQTGNPLIDLAESTTMPATRPAEGTAASAHESASDEGEEGATTQGTFEGFNSPEYPSKVRIIRIPLIPLQKGELQYNVIIHPHDTIVVQNLEGGTYFMGGHIARTGAYVLSPGQRMTLKRAVIAAGMLDALGIPQRTTVIRYVKPNREVFVAVDLDKIFAGEQPDFYLKPDDQVMVGTNALAPFLAALRGSFRLTYGFGFLYDKNFAVNNRTGLQQ